MGLAASQARFLGITARKADCEYKSTELAQQKLEITNQLSDISATYANAMNSTKLIWNNEACNQDYGLTYSLIMTPSDMNNYNPYMITTPTGAVILNSEYAAAAKAAGISKAGAVGSQEARDKFIAALVPGGIITQETAAAITNTDYKASYNPDGSVNLEKLEPPIGTTPPTYQADPAYDPNNVLWNSSAGMGSRPMDKASLNMMDISGLILSESIGQQNLDLTQLLVDTSNGEISKHDYDRQLENYNKRIKDAELAVTYAIDANDKTLKEQVLTEAKNDKNNFVTRYQDKVKDFDGGYFQTSSNNIHDTGFTIVNNGIIEKNQDSLEKMTIGDVLSGNIVLMTQGKNSEEMSKSATKMMEYFARVLGYRQPLGTGLNIDSSTNEAMEYAMRMMKNTFLQPRNAVTEGSRNNDTSMSENSAYIDATQYNRIANAAGYQAVSLSNMISSFLTYFDNYMNGVNSNYVVGKTQDTTNFVTDDSGYMYFGQASSKVPSQTEKLADFYDQLYNNICEHGWRQDDAIQDSEYLESALKSGRYSMSSLNEDGYHYQHRYNETGYIVEVTDQDAIARAEAEFTRVKAELTFKEDSIDMKSKKLDAEISSLSAEYDTVKQLISKSIEKTFQMFQQ